MKKGKIIFLNGVTSSGKTTLSKSLQQISNEHFYHLSNDIVAGWVSNMLHDKLVKEAGDNAWEIYFTEGIVMAYHFAKTLAEQGRNVIIDGMLEETEAFAKYYKKTNYEIMQSALSSLNVFMVEVYCPLEECRRRNIARGDRGENQSYEQHKIMNKTVKHNFSVDTSINSADECAKKILDNFK